MSEQPNPSSKQPNVVLIITDDQGYGTVGAHGAEGLRTPHMDLLSNEGASFSRFYGNPLCSPTRASLMTGRYCYRTGILHTSRGGALMSGDEVTAGDLFTKAGYHTGLFGKWHLGDNYPMRPMDQGFQTAVWHKGGGIGQTPDRPGSYFDPKLYRDGEPFQSEGYCTDIFFDEALSFIETNKDEPFFVYIPTNAPHDPLEISDAYADPYRKMGLDDRVARVYGMVENIDDNIGRLLARLDELGLDDNTVVIFLSDHGPARGRYNAGLRSSKGDVYEGGIRVPFFVRWPGGIEAGKKVDRIAAHIDVLPTLAAVCGLSLPDDLSLDGTDLTPLIDDPVTEWPDRTLFIQTHRGSSPRRYHCCSAISQRYKWLGYPGTGGEWSMEVDRENPVMELYDIEQDVGEGTNLAAQHPDVVQEFRAAYDSWFDDVAGNWKVGTIHIGNAAENPTTLCRYQDSEFQEEFPFGWRVEIERTGTYDVSINRGALDGPGSLHVVWQGKTLQHPLAEGESAARFALEAGKGRLEVWFSLADVGRITFSSNETIGDVHAEWIA
jgi:arylsulfatase A-like enzyme